MVKTFSRHDRAETAVTIRPEPQLGRGYRGVLSLCQTEFCRVSLQKNVYCRKGGPSDSALPKPFFQAALSLALPCGPLRSDDPVTALKAIERPLVDIFRQLPT